VAVGGTNDHLAVYYGNPDADSVAVPRGAARYNFHDDFEDGRLHPDWTGNRQDLRRARIETATNGYPSDGVYSYSRVEIGDNGGSPGAEWDYVRLRYKVSPEPTVTVGQERSVPGDAVVTGTETDRSRTGTSPGGAEDPSTPDGGTDAGSTDQQLADSDGDGTIDLADYAPRDPDVQERSDLESTTDGSGPGFGVGTALVAVLVLLAVVGTRR